VTQWGVVNRLLPAAALLEQGPNQTTFEGR
jgi:hypothetical protein